MISKEQALDIAIEQLKATGLEELYNIDSCEFFEARTGKYPSPARWIVRFMKPPADDGSVTDDGDELFVVRIDAESGFIRAFSGI